MKARRSPRGAATLSAQFPVGKVSRRDGEIIALGYEKTKGNAKRRYARGLTRAVAACHRCDRGSRGVNRMRRAR
jgi:hypothetical protein